MSAIQFTTVVGPDGAIHPPTGITLPQGEIEVAVRSTCPAEGTPLADLSMGCLLELAAEAEKENPDLPSDMAENHDHDAHGAPRR